MNTVQATIHLMKAVEFLSQQEKELRPLIIQLQNFLLNKTNEELSSGDISLEDAFSMYVTLTEQYTNSVLLLTKVEEVVNAGENKQTT